jgi:hypothetical protein
VEIYYEMLVGFAGVARRAAQPCLARILNARADGANNLRFDVEPSFKKCLKSI